MRFSVSYLKQVPVFVLVALLFSECKKEKIAEPEKEELVNTDLAPGIGSTTNVNGYLYSGVQQHFGWSTNSFMFAAFCDPEKKLLTGFNHYADNVQFVSSVNSGNIDVGLVQFSNFMNINKSSFNPNVFYNSATSATTSAMPSWKTEGNGTFKAFDITVTRGYPVINSFTPSTVNKSSPYTLDLSGIVSNHDSVIVTVSDGGSSFGQLVKRNMGSNVSSVTFNTSELSNLFQTSSGEIRIFAYNYSNRTIDSKKYIFELSRKHFVNVIINP